MATPTITNGEEYFFPIIYEGNGGGQRVGKFVPFTDNGTIDNSVIFNHSDTTMQLQLPAPASAGNQKTFTFSCWFKRANLGDQSYLYSVWDGTDDGAPYLDDRHYAQLRTDNTLYINFWGDGVITNRTFEDTSKWYHYLLAVDSTQSTAADRIKLYIDGDLITSFSATSYFAQDSNLAFPKRAFTIGNTKAGDNAQEPFDGYIAEFNAIEGQALTPSTFGVTDTSTGRWIPKTLSGITYGTNGFRLKFQDSSALGDDTSGNGNDFTATNLSASDQTTDSPTQNHATFDSGRNGGDWTLSEGNLKIVGTPSTGAGRICLSGMNVPNSNKIYWEVEVDVNNDSPRYLGIFRDTVSLTAGSSTEDMRYIATRNGGTHDGKVWDGNSTSSQLTTTTSGDIIQFARDGEKLWIGKNNTWLNSGNPSTGANPLFTNIDTNSNWKMGVYSVSTGLPSGTSHTFIMNAGQKSFTYTPPTGFSALQQDNLPETDRGIVGLTWIKDRDNAYSHGLRDSSRGKHKGIFTNLTQAEATYPDGVQRFLKGGIEIEDLLGLNASGASIVAWNWVANSGTTATNEDGSITSTVQANTTAGFSIVEFTSPSSTQDFTVGHGLSVAPRVFFFKRLDSTSIWAFYHQDNFDANGTEHTLVLNTNGASYAPNPGTDMYPSATSSTTFSLRAGASIATSANCVAYCFNEVDGFSKFGSYTGNGNADGPFVYTGFKPAFIMVKKTNASADWTMQDTTRYSINPNDRVLQPNLTSAEVTGYLAIDFLSNGFKFRSTDNQHNASGGTYIYMTFAEHPFVGDGTSPVTAR